MKQHRKRSILFVVEGTSSEPALIQAVMKAFGIASEGYALLMFRTNIHALIDEIVGDDNAEDADFDGIDIKELLADLLENGVGSIGELDYHGLAEHTAGDAEWLRTALVTDVFLIFDFDPHGGNYRPGLLRRFQEAFIDSTGSLGKLLLSYPMIESYKDASALSFDTFRTLEAAQPLKTYKEVVNDRLSNGDRSRYRNLKAYDREVFARGIAASIARACSLTTGKDIQQCYQSIFRSKLSDACDEVDLVRLLEVQQRLFEEHGRVSVVCTALFFLAIWPAPIDHAWTACKSMRLA